jgi:hypothetical protein
MVVALVLYARMSEGWDVESMPVSCCLFIMNAKVAKWHNLFGKPCIAGFTARLVEMVWNLFNDIVLPAH